MADSKKKGRGARQRMAINGGRWVWIKGANGGCYEELFQDRGVRSRKEHRGVRSHNIGNKTNGLGKHGAVEVNTSLRP